MNSGVTIFSKDHSQLDIIFEMNALEIPRKGFLWTNWKPFVIKYSKLLDQIDIGKIWNIFYTALSKDPKSCDHLRQLNGAFLKHSKVNRTIALLLEVCWSERLRARAAPRPLALIDQLPPEIMEMVFLRLGSEKEVRNASLVCRKWQECASTVLRKLYFQFMLSKVFLKSRIPSFDVIKHLEGLSDDDQRVCVHSLLTNCKAQLGKIRGDHCGTPFERQNAMHLWIVELYSQCPPAAKVAIKEKYPFCFASVKEISI